MISPEYMASSYSRNVQIIKMQTEGLSHEQSLIQLPFRGNCLNWIVGHLVTNRNNVLKLLGMEPLIDPSAVEQYRRDSDPITASSTSILPLGQLIQLLEQAQDKIATRLRGVPLEELQRTVAFFGNKEQTVAEWLQFFFFHDSYHTGQAELLRQAAGMNDKII